MSDIVERLRGKYCCDAANCNCDAAAEEIERLRAALSELGVTPEEARAGAARSKAIREERDALRAELAETRSHWEEYAAAMRQNLEDRDAEIDVLRAELDALRKQKEQVPFCRVEDAKHIYELACALGLSGSAPLYLHPIPPAPPAPSVPDGWQLMPIEPTKEILKAMCDATHVLNEHRAMQAYQAALTEAPGADDENFTRAKSQVEQWPEWKRDYTITKDSSKPEAHS